MLSNNFNNLNNEQKNNIYKCLNAVFNKENIDFFIEKKVHKIYHQEREELNLTKEFSVEKWEIFQKIFNLNSFTKNKILAIQKVLSDLEKISEKIVLFNKIDEVFNFDLGIAGGALRDILLMKNPQVKDIDLILSFKYKKHLLEKYFNFGHNKSSRDQDLFRQSVIKTSQNLKEYGFPELDTVSILEIHSLDEMIKEYLMKIIFLIVSKDFKSDVFYRTEFKNTANLKNIINSSEYNDKHLKGVIKIKDKSLNFDLDILLTSVEIESYLKAFDYSICKVMSVFVKDNVFVLKKNDWKEFIKSVIINDEIYEDLIKKEITFNVDRFSQKEIESSIKNHYPRIKEKYPDFKLILKGDRVKKGEIIDTINLMLELKDKLNVDKKFTKEISKI